MMRVHRRVADLFHLQDVTLRWLILQKYSTDHEVNLVGRTN